MAVRPAAAVAYGRAGRHDRSVSGLPQGTADVAAMYSGSVDAFPLVKLGNDMLTEDRIQVTSIEESGCPGCEVIGTAGQTFGDTIGPCLIQGLS